MFPDLRPNIHQHILDLKLLATLLDTRLPSTPKKCLNAVWKECAFGLPHNACGFFICFDKLKTDYEIHLSGDQKGEK